VQDTSAPTLRPTQQPSTAPLALAPWLCPASWFGAKDGCDCECSRGRAGSLGGATTVDPDCAITGAKLWCSGRGAAAGVVCDVTVDRCVMRAATGGDASAPDGSLLTEETKEHDVVATPGLGLGLGLGTVAALGLLLAALAVRRRNSSASSTREVAVAA
jgi:hypothetical protein